MSRSGRRLLWTIVAAGTVLRLVVAFAQVGNGYDIESMRIVGERMLVAPLHAYVDGRYPYPPGFFPWILIATVLEHKTPLPFHGLIKLPMIGADALIALIVVWLLGRRGVSEKKRLAAAMLVAFGPSFFMISGFHGQLDSAAILPAIAALALWEKSEGKSRSVLAGALIGVGVAIKTVPIVMLLALVPTSRSKRETVKLIASTGAVPLLMTIPFLLTTPSLTASAINYTGIPGVGGLSLVLQPRLAEMWLLIRKVRVSSLSWTVWHLGGMIIAVALLAVGVLLLRARTRPAEASVIVWLAVYAFGANFFFQYMVWGLPFFLAAGHVKKVGILQTALLGPLLLAEFRPWDDPRILILYLPVMIGVWAAFLIALVINVRKVEQTRTAEPQLSITR